METTHTPTPTSSYASGTYSTMRMIMGIIRIVLGVFILYTAISNLTAGAETQNFIGNAGNALFEGILSTTTRFWIAIVGKVLAGVMLLTGCKKIARIGAILVLIIMVFAINVVGWGGMVIPTSIAALLVLFVGSGKWSVCTCCKSPKVSHPKDHTDGYDIGDKVTTAAAEAVATTKQASQKLADEAKDSLDAAEDTTQQVAEKTGDKIEDIVDEAEDAIDQANQTVTKNTKDLNDDLQK